VIMRVMILGKPSTALYCLYNISNKKRKLGWYFC